MAASIKFIGELDAFLEKLHPKIGRFGGRFFESEGCSFSANEIVRIFDRVAKNDPEKSVDKVIFRKFRELDQKGYDLLNQSHLLIKIATFIRQFFGNLFYKREKLLAEVEFPEKIPVTSRGEYRLLMLDGDEGTVACRVRGDCLTTLPHFSKEGTVEFSLRSFLRLSNLTAVRGKEAGTRMIGPCDYYGNVEKPHKHLYTIDIDDQGNPIILQEKEGVVEVNRDPLSPLGLHIPTTVKARWISNTNPEIQVFWNQYSSADRPVVGKNIFPQGGILEIDAAEVKLKKFDARLVDLSPFKARLVKNNVPFQLTKEALPRKDEFRAISYLFEPRYAAEDVTSGGGITLETHTFSQTMTPLDPSAAGFVTLGRWKDASKSELEIVAIEIPFGYTLIVDRECIHGDATLSGMYMMLMTSNHKTMQTADCVYLKNPSTKGNIAMTLEGEVLPANQSRFPHPVVAFKGSDTQDNQARFQNATNSTRVIKNVLRQLPV